MEHANERVLASKDVDMRVVDNLEGPIKITPLGMHNPKYCEITKWNVVALWELDVMIETCASCKGKMVNPCMECKSKENEPSTLEENENDDRKNEFLPNEVVVVSIVVENVGKLQV
jgi:hypothetical protein